MSNHYSAVSKEDPLFPQSLEWYREHVVNSDMGDLLTMEQLAALFTVYEAAKGCVKAAPGPWHHKRDRIEIDANAWQNLVDALNLP